jgi:hypothetical protein
MCSPAGAVEDVLYIGGALSKSVLAVNSRKLFDPSRIYICCGVVDIFAVCAQFEVTPLNS